MSLCSGCGCLDKEICIVQGDSYLKSDSLSICISSVGCKWPSPITGVSIVFEDAIGGCGCPGNSSGFSVPAEYLEGPPAAVCFSLSSADTFAMAAGKLRYNFSVIGKLPSGNTTTLAQGRASVVARG